MGIIKQKSDGKGSLKDTQVLINKYPDLLNASLKSNIPALQGNDIEWLSPLQRNNNSEYRDGDFIDLIGLDLTKSLTDFWPKRGPQWDALGRSKNGLVFLVEAKANIPELVSSPSKAEIKSKLLIDKALIETKIFLSINNNVDWSGKFYQYTNRLAHLYFLRAQDVQAWLINIYFINDKSVSGPKTKEEWLGAIKVMKCYLGVGRHKLSKYTIDLFIDVKDLRL